MQTAIQINEQTRQRYVQRCKENAWKRWRHKYLVALLDNTISVTKTE